MKTTRTMGQNFKALLLATAMAIPMLALPRAASALTYVNLVTGEVTSDSSEPEAVSYDRYGRSVPPAPLPEPTPAPQYDLAQQVARFNQYYAAVLAQSQQTEAHVRQQVAAYEQAIHAQEVAREMARSNYLALRSNEAAIRYWAADAQINELQMGRWNLVANFYVSNINMLDDLRRRDPSGPQRLTWYQGWDATYRHHLTQSQQLYSHHGSLHATAIANYRVAAGYPR